MPTTEFIDDQQLGRLMVSIRDNMTNMAKNLMSRDELITAGVLKVNSQGEYVTAAAKAATTAAVAASTYSPVSYKSFVFSISTSTTGSGHVNLTIPNNCRIIRSWRDVTTPFSGMARSTIGLRVAYDGVNYVDIFSPSDISTGWILGLHDGSQTGAAAVMTNKMTADRSVEYVITGDVLVGEANVFIQYALID